MNPEFIPQMPQQFTPPQGTTNGLDQGQMPQQSNAPSSGLEREGTWQKSVRRSKQTRATTKKVIHSRKDLEEFLAHQGIGLLTSAIEFQHSGNFVTASYVVYRNFDNMREPLMDFLQRYPQLKPVVEAIARDVHTLQSDLQITGR